MGLFSIFSSAKALTKIASGVENVTRLLDRFESDNDFTLLCVSAWFCRVSIIEVIEKNKFPMSDKLFVLVAGHQTRMTLGEAFMLSIGRLSSKCMDLEQMQQSYITDILDGGDAFYEIDSQLPIEQKKRLL